MKTKSSISNIILFFVIALGWSGGIWILLNPAIQNKLGLHLNPLWHG